MDSLRFLLENAQNAGISWWTVVRDSLTLLAAMGGPFIAWYAIRKSNEMRRSDLQHSEKLKQLEIQEAARERKFHLQLKVSEQALEVLLQSYHLTHEVNRVFACTGPDLDANQKEDLYKRIMNARIYWEKNLFYLPTAVRNHVYPLTNVLSGTMQGGDVGAKIQMFAFDKVSEMFRDIETALNGFMAEYNLFNQTESQVP